MKILFVTKPFVIDNLGIASLSASLKLNGHTVSLLEVDNELTAENKRQLVSFNPDVLAYSIYTGNHNFFLKLNKQIRTQILIKTKLLSVFGGPHCTYFPDIINEEFVNAVFQGEADYLFNEYLDYNDKYTVKYLLKPMQNPQSLDALPLPDRDIIYQNPKNANNPIKNIMTSRGCPFNCAYCYNSVYNTLFKGRPVRYRSIPLVIEEAERLVKNYPKTRYIFFEDDEFAAKLDRVEQFSQLWKQKVKLPYHVQLRIDLLTEDRIKLLKESGCNSVTFAIEHGNEDWRYKILNRRISNKVILDGAEMLRKNGILFRTENMLAQPHETIEQALETLDLNIKCKATIGWTSLFQPYPKTPLGEYCREKGLFDGNVDDIPQSFFDRTILKMPKKESIRFENLQRIFSFVCSYPFLRTLVPFLINLPKNRFYDWLYKAWKQHKYNIIYNVRAFKNARISLKS